MLSVKEIIDATGAKLLNGKENELFDNFKIDSREIIKGDFYIPLVGEHTDGHNYIKAALLNGAKGFFIQKDKLNYLDKISLNDNIAVIQVDNVLNSMQTIGKYNRKKHMDIPIVAITGSVGKTSTRQMIASILQTQKNVMVTQKNMNGHIGLPLMALKLDKQEIGVFEAGVDFAGEMDILGSILLPEVAVVTNIGVSHIEKFKSRDNIFNEKIKIANYLIGKKVLLLNKDDEYLSKYKNDNVNIKYYSIKEAKNITVNESDIEFDVDIYSKPEHVKLNMLGIHNVLNAKVGIRVAEIYNLPVDKIVEGVNNCRNFTRRMEEIKLKDYTLVDDTYNASYDSAKSGLISVDKLNYNRKIAVLADILELGNYSKDIHRELGKVFKDVHFNFVIAYGDSMKEMADVAKNYTNIIYVKDSKEALEKLKELMRPGDIIYFKGSNAMKVNEIVESIKKDFSH